MPKIGVSKESLEGIAPLPAGRYSVRLDGFSPKKSKKGDSVNLNPTLVVVNHPTLNDRKVFHNCNTAYPPGMFDMSHALGVKFEGEGVVENPEFPGEFQCRVHGPACDSSDPENWQYIGPLVGQLADLDVADTDNGKGGRTTKLAKFHCKVPGCTASHKESLL